ncbi:PQQ-dependent sugar dehydrogenase [Solirubrobacter sp. CPCC 204708]|uniref:PQQ-dependent sugar dehydrogenase n=1 Tax=Solirubrobacter deserti TaxID=2282478 RepID=A0ABT4RU20_9ACTN|nr:PQQ-dependent sugar dehydrogenase [Solirubrobacter deserti]MBE2316248.1 PQQ-dependent sugar dehydrogenase [Solirubrobacter deserti]MDA0142072.1 PQQ-dependent sugar dehydrogenase [Solirubrobacter deserti]
MNAVRSTVGIAAAAVALTFTGVASAQTPTPTVVDPKLKVEPVVTGLNQPVQMQFIGKDDFFVLEKPTGIVKRVKDGVATPVLDLTVNFASERGLLGIALDKHFKFNGTVYLYWSETTLPTDNNDLSAVPTLGNRLDRYHWDGTSLTFEKTIHRGRSFQADPGQPVRGNHNGGVLRVGPDGKIYLQVGDTGRRGQMQNLIDGPFVFPLPATNDGSIGDDQFGGPDPDAAHLTGVILRLNPDGTAPRDNPFYRLGAERGGSVGASLKKVYGYGIRNGFGMAFDPFSGDLWEQENGDDSFSEINRVEEGFNGGWVQLMGPLSRVSQYRAIETTVTPTPPDPNAATYYGLQQLRWDPANIAANPHEAYDRMFKLPGSRYSDPEMSWKYEVAPGGIDFLSSRELGKDYRGDLFVGSARGALRNGNLFRLPISNNRKEVDPEDRRLKDKVADNLHKYEITESESLLFGENFGVTPDLRESPDGTLYVVSSSQNTVYEISAE